MSYKLFRFLLPVVPGCALWLCSCQNSTYSIRERAQAGEAHAQYEYGRRLLTGQKSPKAPELAWGWFQAAAQQGHTKAQAALGVCCQQGLGRAPREQEALNWYTKAAVQGNEHAILALLAHADKQRSTAAAERTLQQLLDAENPIAEFYMATLLLNKGKSKKELLQAVDYLRYAAMSGSGDAALLLALCYAEGKGVYPSPALAMGWFSMAIELQSEAALLILQQMQHGHPTPLTC